MTDAAIPRVLRERHRTARRIVEVGAGDRFETALAWAEAAPRAQVVVTDVRDIVTEAPPPLESVVDDVTKPVWSVYRDADLIYLVRPPEELWVPAAKLARKVDADLAVKPLATEFVDLSALKATVQVAEGWELYRWRR